MIFTSKLRNIFNYKRHFRKLVKFYNSEAASLRKLPSNASSITYANLPSDGLPLVGSLFSFIMAGSSPKLHLYVDAKHKKLGPVFREEILSKSTIFLSDPDKIREVFTVEGKSPNHFLPESWLLYNRIYRRKRGLLFMEKEEWLHYRKIMNQLLLKDQSTEDLTKTYDDVLDSLVKKWKRFAGTGDCIENVGSDMYVHSISFILATAMGSSYKDHKKLFFNDLENLARSYQQIFEATSNLMVVPVALASKLNFSSWKSFVSALDRSLLGSEAVVSKMKKHMSKDGLLSKLLDAGVSDKMASILLIDLMMAAGDTTAYTMQWAFYLLGKYRSIQDKVRTDENLIKGVIKETLRLYPAAPFLTREIHQPLKVSGYHIPANEMIIMSMYTCGRSESNFPNANEFQPERWTRNAEGHTEGVTNKFASLPFAMGVRSCVGKKLAETLITMTIKAILSNYKLTTTNDVEMILRLTPAPSEKIRLIIENQ